MRLEYQILMRFKNLQKHNSLFHSDTVQSVGHYDLDFEKIKVDFFVASAHKFHGPKGIGFVSLGKIPILDLI